PFLYMLDRPFLELDRVFLLRDLLHRLPPKSNVNCTSPLEDYLSGEAHLASLNSQLPDIYANFNVPVFS
ncbi:MAG: hypothetical protein NTW90_09875, partial [Nitrosospira sp.]|nr:hypothetical protein [Nitrosospira sp.]